MPSSNSSKNSKSSMPSMPSMSSFTFGKNKNSIAIAALLILLILAFIGYFYMYKSNTDSFLSSDKPNLKPAQGECVVALFYAEWCGHCKTFKPEFEKAKKSLDGKKSNSPELKDKKVRFEKIDCDENKDLAKKYDISGYPTVKIITDDGDAIDYDGKRSFEGLQKYLNMNVDD